MHHRIRSLADTALAALKWPHTYARLRASGSACAHAQTGEASLSGRLVRSTRGSVTTEFAFTVPVFISLVVGIIEVGNYFFLNATLENAVLHASRFGIVGGSDDGVTREARVREVIRKQTFGRIPYEDLEIETLVYESFADINQPEPYEDTNGNGVYDSGEPFSDVNGNGVWDQDIGAAGLGNAGDIVLYRISYPAPSLTGLFDWATRNIQLTATVAVRNEPY